jgi:AcrR family transcriptional regulator
LTKPIVKQLNLGDPVVVGILDAATAEFAQHGLGGARLERIIANTDTSKRMVYYHFGSKEGLYKAVLEHVFNAVRLTEKPVDPLAGTPQEALQNLVEQAFGAFTNNPAFVRLLTLENLNGVAYIRSLPSITQINAARVATLTTVVERGQRAGVFRPEVNPADVYMNLVGLCYYHVANRAGYLTGFSGPFAKELSQGTFDEGRMRSIMQSVLRYVQA